MTTQFVLAVVDIDCEWEGTNPAYRVYVNDELFSERTWIWSNTYLEELLQINATPGQYVVRIESVESSTARFTLSNHRIEHGSARWIDHQCLEIINEST